jgi:hypothetical protein
MLYDRRISWPLISILSVKYCPCLYKNSGCKVAGTSNFIDTASVVSGRISDTFKGWNRAIRKGTYLNGALLKTKDCVVLKLYHFLLGSVIIF